MLSRLLNSRLTRLIILIIVLVSFVLMIMFLPLPKPIIEVAAEPVISTPFALLGFPFAITNTLIASWLSMLVLILFAFFATRKMKMVPSGLQNLAELLVETMYNFYRGIAGERVVKFFPWAMTIFVWVLLSNWMGLLPGFGSIGYLHEVHDAGKASYKTETLVNIGPVHIYNYTAAKADVKAHETGYALVPFFRSAGSDLSFTATLALISVAMTQLFGLQALGLDYINRFIPFKSLWELLGGHGARGMDLIVGPLEGISEAAKIISFSFRLFGNVFAGEVLLAIIASLIPYIVPLPFYGLEIFVGAMQAFVFGVLTLVFMTMATTPHGAEGH